ncbi:MAG: M23 family metallopeptidase [Rudaea sp.]
MYIYPRRRQRRIPILVGFLAFFCTGCLLLALVVLLVPSRLFAALNLPAPRDLVLGEATETPTLIPTPDAAATATARARPRPTNTRIPTKTPLPSPTLKPTATPILVATHFLIGRPVGPNSASDIPAWTYLYGDTANGDAQVHHGEEFVNPTGTPLLAVADGTVVVAGDDSDAACGPQGRTLCGPIPSFYGNLVVLQLDQAYGNQPVFVLYGHMSSVDVQPGQHISSGTRIGAVGDSGVARGPHVHLEVRLGVNDYAHTRNPILWMRPLPGTGAIAGMVLDQRGNFVRSVNVSLYYDNENEDYIQDTETYGRDADTSIAPVNSDERIRENWAMGDIRAGRYLVSAQVAGLSYLRHVTIEDGKLTFVVFGGP